MLEIIQTNAARAASKYKRRCWWTSFEDMKQEAITAQLEAYSRNTFDESFGRPLSAYLWTVAKFAVSRLVHKASAPVSASHRTEVLVGLRSAPLNAMGEGPRASGPEEHAHVSKAAHVDTQANAATQDRASRVRARVVELVGAKDADFAFCVITHEWRANEVAQEAGVSVQVVYAAQRRISNTLIGDRVLYNLWKESDK